MFKLIINLKPKKYLICQYIMYLDYVITNISKLFYSAHKIHGKKMCKLSFV
jgi:hypothetical protein